MTARLTWKAAIECDRSLFSLNAFFTEPPVAVIALAGGLTNRCWKITTAAGKSYVWRAAANHCRDFGIDRDNERQVLEHVYQFVNAPKVVFQNSHGLLVEWLEGTSIKDVSSSQAVELLVGIHQIPISDVELPRFDFEKRIQHYWQQLENKYGDTEFAMLTEKWGSAVAIENREPVLCHFDLGEYNLVHMEDNQIGIIDWEYSAVSDPCLDLALTNLASPLPDAQTLREQVVQYCEWMNIEAREEYIQAAQAWWPRGQLLAMLWYLVAHCVWEDDEYFNMALEVKDSLCRYDHCFDS